MTITTRFQVHQTVFLLHANAVLQGTVRAIQTTTEPSTHPDDIRTRASYTLSCHNNDVDVDADEETLFATKQELLESL